MGTTLSRSAATQRARLAGERREAVLLRAVVDEQARHRNLHGLAEAHDGLGRCLHAELLRPRQDRLLGIGKADLIIQQQQDAVGVEDGREPVRNDEGRAAAGQFTQFLGRHHDLVRSSSAQDHNLLD